MRFLPGNAQHVGKRSEQQDSFGFTDQSDTSFTRHAGVVGVVADGMGGLAHGKAASQAAIQAFLQAYHSKDPVESIPDALLRAIRAANEAVVNVGRQTGAVERLGTTLAAAALHQQGLNWISAGDSRVYLSSSSKITRLTIDHIYANDLDRQVARGQTTRFVAESHPERASLTSYLGLVMLPNIDRSLKPLPVKSGDWAIVCSDGLYRSVSDEDIAGALREDASRSCENLIEKALAANNPAQDNLTVLAFKCESEALTRGSGSGKLSRSHTMSAAVTTALILSGILLVWGRSEKPVQSRAAGRQAHAVIQPLVIPGVKTPSTPEPARSLKVQRAVQEPAPLEIQHFQAVSGADGAKLIWNLAGADGQSCKLSIVNGIGAVIGDGLPPSESSGFPVPAFEPTEYILKALCGNRTLSESVLVGPKPPIVK